MKLVKERQILYDITYMWNLKIQQTSESNQKKKQTHRYGEPIVVTRGEMEGGEAEKGQGTKRGKP